jgi:two-component system response regulator RegX3
MAKVLIIEDDDVIAQAMAHHLSLAGFDPQVASDGDAGLRRLRFEAPDVCVVDLMLPRMDGWRLIESARSEGVGTPIIVVSARGTEHDRVHALEIGADDYLVKPFSPRELVARVRAILRRSGDSPDPPADLLVIDGGRLEVDVAAHEARLEGSALPLTAAEFRLLATLARQPRRVFSRFELLETLQGPDAEGFERTVDVHVMRLRKKMDEMVPGSAECVKTVYGVGYRLDETR